jgi:cell division septation protein DedD
VEGGRWRVVAALLASESAAQGLAKRLQAQGYPAVIRTKDVAGKTVHEVRLNQLATRADAQAVLDRIASVEGVNGRVALSA